MATLASRAMTPDFASIAVIPDGSGGAIGPFVSAAHFRMRQPTFPPHPHAGFSAVTYVLEQSKESILNRDSEGRVGVIGAGALHWTAANCGIMHEETPLHAGGMVDGLQVFINQPASLKGERPTVFHADPGEFAVSEPSAGVRVKLIAGDFAGHSASAPAASPLVWLQLDLSPDATFEWARPEGFEAFAYVEQGAARPNGKVVKSPGGLRLDEAASLSVEANDQAVRLFLFAGLPLDEPIVMRGPMIMASEADIDAAYRRFQSGEMGRLAPRVYDRVADAAFEPALATAVPTTGAPMKPHEVSRAGGVES